MARLTMEKHIEAKDKKNTCKKNISRKNKFRLGVKIEREVL